MDVVNKYAPIIVCFCYIIRRSSEIPYVSTVTASRVKNLLSC